MLKNTFKKIDLINKLSNETGLSANLSKKIINDLIDASISIIKLETLIIKNLGSIKTINKAERIGRNPKTKELFKISARKSISFTPSKKLIKIIDKFYDKIN